MEEPAERFQSHEPPRRNPYNAPSFQFILISHPNSTRVALVFDGHAFEDAGNAGADRAKLRDGARRERLPAGVGVEESGSGWRRMQTRANESRPQKVPVETGSHDYLERVG